MSRHFLDKLPQCDRPVLTLLDVLDDVYYRSVVILARRVGLSANFVDDELRKLVRSGDVERLPGKPGQVPVLACYRRSTAWRLDVSDLADDTGAASRGGLRRRVDPRHDVRRGVTPPDVLPMAEYRDVMDARVADFLAFGVERGAAQ